MFAGLSIPCGSQRGPFLAVLLTCLLVVTRPGVAGDAIAQTGVADLARLSDAVETLAAEVSPAVVQIFTTAQSPGQGLVRSTGDLVTTERGSGSGVIVDPSGYIITNAHVVLGASRIQVRTSGQRPRPGRSILPPGGELVGAQLVGVDRETDLAVLKIDRTEQAAIEFGDSDGVRIGQLVLAFGSPRGLENSVTMGVVSAVARQLRPEDPMIYLQTDAPINPGSSGGPLVDTSGQLVGINTLIVSQSGGNEGLGFAAPSNIVRAVYEQIRRTGHVRRGEIGVSVQTITPGMAAGLGLGRQHGVIVADVLPQGPADRAGLLVGDVVLQLNDKVMENARQLLINLYPRAVAETVTLDVLRGDLPLRFEVTVVERAGDPRQLEALANPARHLVPRLGVLALSLDASIARMLPPVRFATGVVVAATAADGAAARAGGFAPGDTIYAVNGERVHRLEELRERLSGLARGTTVVVQLERRSRLRYLTFVID